jgi:hypothetical protein
MGQALIIKGADFSTNAVGKIKTDKDYFDKQIDNAFFAWGYTFKSNYTYGSGTANRAMVLINQNVVENKKYPVNIGGRFRCMCEIPASINTLHVESNSVYGFNINILDSNGEVIADKRGVWNSIDDTIDLSDINTTCFFYLIVMIHENPNNNIPTGLSFEDLDFTVTVE